MRENSLQIRPGAQQDEEWIFQLFKNTMRDYIDAAWGWEELLQKEGFVTSLPARDFKILTQGGKPIGCFHISQKPDHVVLDMIMVQPDYQRQGHGSYLMKLIKQDASSLGKPLRLSVLKSNPAVSFHEQAGFAVASEDEHSFKMVWVAEAHSTGRDVLEADTIS